MTVSRDKEIAMTAFHLRVRPYPTGRGDPTNLIYITVSFEDDVENR